ncbi:tRNA-dihydrouridine synthase [Candidatus Babeliales bacterium]|nr:tRNA-dihydrouridine synthase [Candidatus Babeliales bacterium]MCF7899318.1 tRNA-dihydrouridine synthase [Candidatus Babeliales bacterium]
MKNFWLEKFKIGNLEIPRFMSAPIDGVTDSPLRQLIREFSNEELLFTEMRHVACVAHQKDEQSLHFDPIEQPLCFQISANKINFIDKAIEKILSRNIKILNLNAGCPAKNIIKSGSGSALMANLPQLKLLIETISQSCQTHSPNQKIPLTLKIRAGFKEKNALEVSLLAQDLGVKAIIIHPRTQPQGFIGNLDFDLVKKLKEELKIPVIFSGNINSFERAKLTYEKTGVDGFMIGRALYGAPWKIHEIKEESQGRKFLITNKQMVEYAIKHLNLCSKFYGSHGFQSFKKQVPLYIKKIENASQIRLQLLRSQSEDEMREILKLCSLRQDI